MAKERTQPTPIDKQEYEAFKNFVRDVHGSTRGHLGSEIENALREYRKRTTGAERLQRIEDDIATIKANIAQAESDGGTVAPTPSEASDTHARRTEKPPANQSRGKKIDYLTTAVLDESGNDKESGSVAEAVIRNVITNEYAFGDDTTDEYVELILDRLDAVPHPEYAEYMWGDRIDEEREELQSQAEKEAESKLDDLE